MKLSRHAGIFTAFFLASCATTRTTTEVAPERAQPPYARLAVVVAAPIGPSRAAAESIFSITPEWTGTQLIPSSAVPLPTTQVGDSALRSLLEAAAIDGVLIVRLEDFAVKTTRDQHRSSMCIARTPTQCLNTAPVGAENWEYRGGRVTFRAVLWDAKTLRSVWVGRTEVYLNGPKDRPAIPELSSEVLQALTREHLLLPPPSGR